MALLISIFFVITFKLAVAETITNDTEENIYYARCNLKVIKGNYITWVNWQSTPTFIPVGAKLKVTRSGSMHPCKYRDWQQLYMDIGADGDAFLEKFVTKTSGS